MTGWVTCSSARLFAAPKPGLSRRSMTMRAVAAREPRAAVIGPDVDHDELGRVERRQQPGELRPAAMQDDDRGPAHARGWRPEAEPRRSRTSIGPARASAHRASAPSALAELGATAASASPGG